MRRLLAPLALVPWTGCADTTFSSEQGQLRFETHGLVAGGYRDVSPDLPVLVGTEVCATVCLEIGGRPCDEASIASAAACFAVSAEGPGAIDAGCLTLDGPGEVRWAFTPTGCDDGGPFTVDGVTFRAVDPGDVTGQLVFPNEERVLQGLAEGASADGSFLFTTADAEGLPDHLVPEAGAPVRIVADGTAQLHVGLALADGTPVMWPDTDAQVDVSGAGVVTQSATGAVVTPGSAGGEVSLRTPVATFAAGTWERVSPRRAVQLEVVAVLIHGADGRDAPLGARAIVRDADGAPLFGAPVAWGVEGDALAVNLGDAGASDRAYASFDGVACRRPSEQAGDFEATVAARYRGLDDAVTLAWSVGPFEGTAEALAAADAAWTLPEACVGPLPPATACGCRAADPASGLAAVGIAGLLALRGRGRRRSASR